MFVFFLSIHAERSPWFVRLRSTGTPGHGSSLYDDSAMERMSAALSRVYVGLVPYILDYHRWG